MPRHPVGEPLPAASEQFAFQIRGITGVPGVPDGLYYCDTDDTGAWGWYKLGGQGQVWGDDLLAPNVTTGHLSASAGAAITGAASVSGNLTVGGTVNGVTIPQPTGTLLKVFNGVNASFAASSQGVLGSHTVTGIGPGVWEIAYLATVPAHSEATGNVGLILDNGAGGSVETATAFTTSAVEQPTLTLAGTRSGLTTSATIRLQIDNNTTGPVGIAMYSLLVVGRRTS